MTEKTDWYPPEIKPVRVGVYETLTEEEKMAGGGPGYNYWDGEGFCMAVDHPQMALPGEGEGHTIFTLYWRGLSREPK